MIESIKIKIGETVLELSLEDAKNLKKDLDLLLGVQTVKEYIPYHPWKDTSGEPYKVTFYPMNSEYL